MIGCCVWVTGSSSGVGALVSSLLLLVKFEFEEDAVFDGVGLVIDNVLMVYLVTGLNVDEDERNVIRLNICRRT